jgi:hypothetical protein
MLPVLQQDVFIIALPPTMLFILRKIYLLLLSLALFATHSGAMYLLQLSARGAIIQPLHCGENSRIFRDAAEQTLPVTEYSEIDN